MIGLIVVQEIFDDDYIECSKPVLDVYQRTNTPSVLVDYAAFHLLTLNFSSPNMFINGLLRIFDVAIKENQFPKSRFLGRIWNEDNRGFAP